MGPERIALIHRELPGAPITQRAGPSVLGLGLSGVGGPSETPQVETPPPVRGRPAFRSYSLQAPAIPSGGRAVAGISINTHPRVPERDIPLDVPTPVHQSPDSRMEVDLPVPTAPAWTAAPRQPSGPPFGTPTALTPSASNSPPTRGQTLVAALANLQASKAVESSRSGGPSQPGMSPSPMYCQNQLD